MEALFKFSAGPEFESAPPKREMFFIVPYDRFGLKPDGALKLKTPPPSLLQ